MSGSWRHHLEVTLTKAWLRRGPIALTLAPLALLYRTINELRAHLYALGILKSVRVNAKVVVIGNVVAGGAGKTPTIIGIAQSLAKCGYRLGVISRGYGRESTEMIAEVLDESDPSLVGDEPLLIKRSVGIPVFVGRDRVATAQALLKAHPEVKVLLCDDGIQHLRLYRDAEIYVFDDRGLGNGLPLPAGPLRSPWPIRHLPSVGQDPKRTLVLHTGSIPKFDGFRAHRSLANVGYRSDGCPVDLTGLGKDTTRQCIAVAGIAQPDQFFSMLREKGIPIRKYIPLPDHYKYSASTLPQLQASEEVLCTEKDAAKLWKYVPHAIAVPLEQRLDATLLPTLLSLLHNDQRSFGGYH